MLLKKIYRAVRFPFALVLGCLMIVGGTHLERWRSPQVDFFNLGQLALSEQNPEAALELFDHSLSAYEQTRNDDWFERFVFPDADLELAARAHFLRGIAFVMSGDALGAVEAFQASLKLNPGNGYATDLPSQQRLEDLALLVKYNLELLFSENPTLARRQGAQQPTDGEGEPLPVPGDQPSSGAGSGSGSGDDL
jgi:tetratricopeptide (TPR) repeat protein